MADVRAVLDPVGGGVRGVGDRLQKEWVRLSYCWFCYNLPAVLRFSVSENGGVVGENLILVTSLAGF